MAEVAGAFLSASVQALVETTTSVQFRDFFRKIRKLNVSLLDELETTLLTLQAVLNDAEQKQITNPAVKEWLERLKDAVDDAEDLLDEVNTEALRHKLDKEKLMSLLLSNDANCNNNMGVITIFGMGGVGKTTLAQLLYNDHRVEEHFDLKAWASVSEVFDVTVVTKTLLESAASKHFENDNLDFLQIELRRILKGKKFLFVLDDLWNNRYVEWDDLITPFNEGKEGSRIIITTRQGDVAQMTHTFPIYHLEPLSHEDCWSLLSKHAFENADHSRYPNLEVVGRDIAGKCGGLPIAAKTLGGILRSKVDEYEWTNILNSDLWELLNDDVLPALWLSYLSLPAQLKRCFAYCSIFPNAFPLNRKHEVVLWMAERVCFNEARGNQWKK